MSDNKITGVDTTCKGSPWSGVLAMCHCKFSDDGWIIYFVVLVGHALKAGRLKYCQTVCGTKKVVDRFSKLLKVYTWIHIQPAVSHSLFYSTVSRKHFINVRKKTLEKQSGKAGKNPFPIPSYLSF